MVDMLAIIIARAKVDVQVKEVVPHLVDEGLSILQYANDTIIFLDHDIDKAKNIKVLNYYYVSLNNYLILK
jgi:hypothetical protein